METTRETLEPEPSGTRRRPKLLVFLFSLIPGAGHMYLGAMTRGLQLMALFFGTLFITVTTGSPVDQLWPILVAPVLWFYSFFDSLEAAGRVARGEEVADTPIPYLQLGGARWGRAAGWALVVLGGLALLNNLGFMIPGLHLWVRRLLGPAVLVGVGVWLLKKDTSPGKEGR